MLRVPLKCLYMHQSFCFGVFFYQNKVNGEEKFRKFGTKLRGEWIDCSKTILHRYWDYNRSVRRTQYTSSSLSAWYFLPLILGFWLPNMCTCQGMIHLNNFTCLLETRQIFLEKKQKNKVFSIQEDKHFSCAFKLKILLVLFLL